MIKMKKVFFPITQEITSKFMIDLEKKYNMNIIQIKDEKDKIVISLSDYDSIRAEREEFKKKKIDQWI
jgi:hypothetical protein